jgi:Bacterial Ig-like domain (group 2)
MSLYQVVYNATTRVAKIQNNGDTPGSGFTSIGTFRHNADAQDNLGPDISHVYWQHVRDLLYLAGHQNMQNKTILIPVGAISLGSNFGLAIGATKNLAPVITPPGATNQAVVYSSATPAKATVDVNGIVKGIAAGTSVITATSADTGVTSTVTVTVS